MPIFADGTPGEARRREQLPPVYLLLPALLLLHMDQRTHPLLGWMMDDAAKQLNCQIGTHTSAQLGPPSYQERKWVFRSSIYDFHEAPSESRCLSRSGNIHVCDRLMNIYIYIETTMLLRPCTCLGCMGGCVYA
eukprot:GHVU01217534.1.p1 GENE.GHVU01217534.1~~GHVU01217534.1.p1  ORF type:complete len:134 (+),score=4.02 GHVU01217534.1:71-472(+)